MEYWRTRTGCQAPTSPSRALTLDRREHRPRTVKPFVWPNGARAAVNLACDDALDSQLDNAIPALDKYGLKGTFYLTMSGETVSKRLADWRAAAAHGHELANRTLFHQCSGTGPGRE